jgi:hypothetical protein
MMSGCSMTFSGRLVNCALTQTVTHVQHPLPVALPRVRHGRQRIRQALRPVEGQLTHQQVLA